MAAMAPRGGSWSARSIRQDGPAHDHFGLRLSAQRLAHLANRHVEAEAMKHVRFTNAHQSITFSRRMMLLGGAQAAVGTMLIGRMGWLAIAQNQKYQLLSESNRVQLIPVPPRRGWIIDRNGKPIAINKASFRGDLIPQQIVNGPQVVAALQKLMNLPPDEVERISRELAQSRGFQPVSVAAAIATAASAAVAAALLEAAAKISTESRLVAETVALITAAT